jgi:hypothetical protein
MAMKRPFTAAVLIVFMILGGCSKNEAPGNTSEKEKAEPKLKALLASTDRVLIKDFYAPQVFSPAVPPPKSETAYHILTTWIPGHISFEPITVTEPPKEQGKESIKLKGIKVDVLSMNFMVGNTKGEQHSHTSFLDDDEARDFDAALSYLSSSAGDWAKQKPDHEREIAFHSKDQFDATLVMLDDELAIVARSGDIGAAMLKIPAAQTGEVQEKLRAALKVLDSH